MAVASSSQNTYSNEKVKAELTTDFLDQYIKTFHIYNHLKSWFDYYYRIILFFRISFTFLFKGNKVSLAIETFILIESVWPFQHHYH
jgi:hypothetical protein